MIIPTDDALARRAGGEGRRLHRRTARRGLGREGPDDWRDGLKLVEQLSQDDQRQAVHAVVAPTSGSAVLTRMAQNERKPEKPEERFFVELKSRVVHAYYTSEIGIKQEMEYKGNTYLAEFVGTDVS